MPRNSNGHEWAGIVQPGTPDGPAEHVSACKRCGMEEPGSADDIPACPPACEDGKHEWRGDYYGTGCAKCGAWYAHGCAPWDDAGDDEHEG